MTDRTAGISIRVASMPQCSVNSPHPPIASTLPNRLISQPAHVVTVLDYIPCPNQKFVITFIVTLYKHVFLWIPIKLLMYMVGHKSLDKMHCDSY